MLNRQANATITDEVEGSDGQTTVRSRLEQTARQLARRHTITIEAGDPRQFLKRIPQQAALLRAAYDHFAQASAEGLVPSYAAEWLLDNYYVIQQALRQVEEDLPPDYYRQLPKLNDGSSLHGYPRIYDLGRAILLYEEGHLDLDRMQLFITAYQSVRTLTMGELWALPIMLRLTILESLAQAVGRISGLATGDGRSAPVLPLEYRLNDADLVANCIPSLRLLSAQDWEQFFEKISHVETILRRDPAALYGQMDFDTRDRYRKVVEELALPLAKDESAVAQAAIELAQAACPAAGQPDLAASPWTGLRLPLPCHVGYYLVDHGRRQLEKQIGYRPAALEWLRRWLFAHPTLIYLGSITALTLLLLLLLVRYGTSAGAGANGQLILVVLLAIIPVVSIVTSLVNWLVTHTVSPRVLPKLEFSDGVPAQCRTMVVVPALLSNQGEVTSLLNQLELHYLRNPDPHLTFALLTDFADAPEEQMPEDAELVEAARQGVEALNGRYPDTPFYLFHRRRLWNPLEGSWMGWERKRGKLHEFNSLLRGDGSTSFMLKVGRLDRLPAVRYVITLDADTILPRDAAPRLIGALAHPLNRAQFDPHSGRVVAGYTILQPRTEVMPTSANQSLFTRVFAGDTGLDLYTLAVSDVYQDLFGEGIYVGKGIYDVDAFERSLYGAVPDNSLLSHDLFEGIQGRAALVTDVVLYEDYPPHYLVHVRRSHRWIRGDWQLLPWLLPWVREVAGWRRNRLALIDLWKIVDNLRRSLLAPALLLLFMLGWTVLPGSPLVWTLLALSAAAVPLVTSLAAALAGIIGGASPAEQLRPVRDNAVRWLLFLAFLPFEALLAMHAALITLVRLLLTRKRLLQWTTAAHTTRLFDEDAAPGVTHRQMLSSLLLAAVLTILVVVININALALAAPFLLLWTLGPEIAHWISRPSGRLQPDLSASQKRRLRTLARRTWLFFEQYVGPDDNWLPPDHYQESPRGVVAQRTSPTNVGMYLLSAQAAYDFGYIGALGLALRLRSTFDTLAQLERYRGHFLNWIETTNLAPLLPRYVSTVDSGNLAGCLLALKQGCLELPRMPVGRWARWQGLLDLLALLEEVIDETGYADHPGAVAFQEKRREIEQRITAVQETPEAWPFLLMQITDEARPELDRRLLALVESHAGSVAAEQLRSCRLYAERLHHHLLSMRRELDLLVPWSFFLSEPPALFTTPGIPPLLAYAWRALKEALPLSPQLDELLTVCVTAEGHLAELQAQLMTMKTSGEPGREAEEWCRRLNAALSSTRMTAQSLLIGYDKIVQQINEYVAEMDFRFLFNEQRQVFHIGYNVDTGRLDHNYYDLLASEARIASLVAIAKNDVPQSHWLHLARPLTTANSGRTLLSWSGTMFEYLMPPLLMRSYEGTLLYESDRAAIRHQVAYGERQGVPWGISESGFYTFDAAMNYQYRAFGIPDLGFKRGLAEDLVVAPYASLLALPFLPQSVMANIEALRERKMLSRYGFYEAVDFTRSRLPLGREQAIVRSFMSHHQGMIMVALVNYLQGDKFVERFHAEPSIQSVELLLQEQVPQRAPLEEPRQQEAAVRPPETAVPVHPWAVPAHTPWPLVHFLSNGRYRVLISNAGSGYSQWRDVALTRWRADSTLDNRGYWIYVEDRDRGAFWSAGQQPVGAVPDNQEILFHPHMAEFRRRDHGISLAMEITVAPQDDVEIRRITLTNDSDEPRRLRLTSYAEVVLAELEADLRHPAFVKLFVESEYFPGQNALLFRRRPRSAEEEPVFLAHAVVLENGEARVSGAYESDRARFLGRGHTARRPQAMTNGRWLSGTTGSTLDPVFSLGQEIELERAGSVTLAFLTIAGDDHDTVIDLLAQYQSWSVIDRAFSRARTVAERALRRLELATPDLEQVQQLLSLLIYPHSALRAKPAVLNANELAQPGLWAFGISGDYPILLVKIHEESEGPLLQDLLRAHTYWRRRGLKIDMVIFNEQGTNYGQQLQSYVYRLAHRLNSDHWLDRRGGIFVLRVDQMSEAEHILLQTAARVTLDGSAGSLSQQLAGQLEQRTLLPIFAATLDAAEVAEPMPPLERPADLQFDNGLGGFSIDGREYVIYLEPGQTTPAPWINVIANPDFGFLVSETGGGNTWSINSGENRLTPWQNDPVSDEAGEALYLRDEETAEIWSPLPQPAPAAAPYLIRHGAGYSRFEHHSHGLIQEVRQFAAPDEPVRMVVLRLANRWQRPRRLTATFYTEWVLGTERGATQQYIVPEYDEAHQALLARNPYSIEFGERVAFVASSHEPHSLTADRAEFLGRLGSRQQPAALRRVGLESRVRAGLDPCAAVQLHIDLAPGATDEVYFLIGQGADREAALELIRRYQQAAHVTAAWEATQTRWEEILARVTVETPDAAMNLLLNRWLLYQALACRIWGRSALYQSSGAYGFRDQLQDVTALVFTRPDLAREQILRAAAHQFEAGDVLHWWHPPSGRGVRTRISDDLLWLPYVTAHYVASTGDETVLDEPVPFLRGKPLAPDEEERYGLYETTAETDTLFEHCRRALQKGSTAGRHGLPLMGGGDWNDGMNRVGIEGHGESIWLGWFLLDTLNRFAELCEGRTETALADEYRRQAVALGEALEAHGWDGEWYRRAYYDDGTPLGSALNRECQIDAIAQSWGVLSGAADPERAAQAMTAVKERLVKWDEQLILLFTPPLDQTSKDPGYIKGYVPGIRENGGQYTHAALWTIWAFAKQGQGDMADSLFQLINPIYRSDKAEKAEHYKVEPYVVAADVYGVEPHTGRGGWSWYTGSSGWMYRVGLEAILGLRRTRGGLCIDPCICSNWSGYRLTYRHGRSIYEIEVDNPEGVNRGVKQVLLDGEVLSGKEIALKDDGRRHRVQVTLG